MSQVRPNIQIMNSCYFEEADGNGVKTLYKNEYKKVSGLTVDLSTLMRNYDEESNSYNAFNKNHRVGATNPN